MSVKFHNTTYAKLVESYLFAMDVIVSDSCRGHVADTAADKLVTCHDISDGDETCRQKWVLADTT